MNFINNRDRLRLPLIKRNGSFEIADWDEALGIVAERLNSFKGDQFAAVASPSNTNEELYLLNLNYYFSINEPILDLPSTAKVYGAYDLYIYIYIYTVTLYFPCPSRIMYKSLNALNLSFFFRNTCVDSCILYTNI